MVRRRGIRRAFLLAAERLHRGRGGVRGGGDHADRRHRPRAAGPRGRHADRRRPRDGARDVSRGSVAAHARRDLRGLGHLGARRARPGRRPGGGRSLALAFWAMAPITVVAAALTWRLLRTADGRATHTGRRYRSVASPSSARAFSVSARSRTPDRRSFAPRSSGPPSLPWRSCCGSTGRPAYDCSRPGCSRSENRLGKGYWMVFLLGMSTTPGRSLCPAPRADVHGISPAAAGYLYAVQSLAWTAGTFLSARVPGDRRSPHDRAGTVAHGVGIHRSLSHHRLGSDRRDRGGAVAGRRGHRHVLGTHRRRHPVLGPRATRAR